MIRVALAFRGRRLRSLYPGLLAYALGIAALSCNQPFDPRGSLDERLVVFSILSTDRTQQIVRVEHSYMPADFDPASSTTDLSVVGARVTIRSVSGQYVFHDTTFPRSDTIRYNAPLRGYVLNQFKADYGKSYLITVQSGSYATVTGSVLVPFKAKLSLEPSSYTVIDDPIRSAQEARILFPIVSGYNAKAFIGRLFVYYDVLKDGEWREECTEIPVGYKYSGQKDLDQATYGSLVPRTSTGLAVGIYSNELYNKMLSRLAYETYKGNKIVFNRVVFVVLQLDPNLYNSYAATHSNNDPHSIRLDEPSYSNVAKGSGAIGAYTLDSLVHLLPDGFGYDKY